MYESLNLYGSPFAAVSNTYPHVFPVMGHTNLTEEEVANLADLFPSVIYFSTEDM